MLAGQLVMKAGVTCTTAVNTTFGISRVCASEVFRPSGFNCANSQQHNRTLVELTFGNSQATGCIGSDPTCTWYDISVIPSNCTNCTWDPTFGGNFCAATGGAAYNLPVRLSCANQPTFTCQGPGNLGAAKYPGACGMTTLKTTSRLYWPKWPKLLSGLLLADGTGQGSCGYKTPINAPNTYCNNAKTGLKVEFMRGA